MAHVDATRSLLMLACAFAAPPLAGAAVIDVAPGASVQAAIDGAVDGDEVVLAPGNYFESIDLRGLAVTVRSQDPQDANVVAATVLDGGGRSTVVTCWSGEGRDTVLAGLTITGAFGTSGGGLSVDGSSPTIRSCRVLGNDAMFEGGGLFVVGGSPLVVSCALGAYELQAPESEDCVGDLNGNGRVGFRDLVSVLRAYGTLCTVCPEDLDGSGAVDLDDVMLLIEGWGLCDGEKDRWRGGRKRTLRRSCGPARRVVRKGWRRR